MGEKSSGRPGFTPGMPKSESPYRLLTLLEVPRALVEASSLLPARTLLHGLDRGDGHSVMTLPGFLATGRSMRIVRKYLRVWGYDAHCWEMGRNLGLLKEHNLEELLNDRLAQLNDSSGEKVSLVGWSLGGLFARELARRNPERVRTVITMGSPIGNPKATNAWRLYERVSRTRVDGEAIRRRVETVRDPIEGIPMTAVFSQSDAIVSANIATLPPGPLVENVGVVASHFGMGFNPAVLYLIADRLAQDVDRWKPFDIHGLRKVFFH